MRWELELMQGHDLSLDNLAYFAQNIPELLEVSIGHALICESLYLGFENVIPMYLQRLVLLSILHSNIIGTEGKELLILHGFLGMGDNWKSHAKNFASLGLSCAFDRPEKSWKKFLEHFFFLSSYGARRGGLLPSARFSKGLCLGAFYGWKNGNASCLRFS